MNLSTMIGYPKNNFEERTYPIMVERLLVPNLCIIIQSYLDMAVLHHRFPFL